MLQPSLNRKRAAVHEHAHQSFRREALNCFLYAVLISFLVEALARHNPLEAAQFVLQQPLAFFYNTLLVTCSFSIALIVRRRLFAYCLLFTVWGVLGIVNFSLSSIRMTPLSFYDAVIFVNNLSITTAYLSFLEVVLLVLLAIALIAALALLFMRAPTIRPHRNAAIKYALSLCAFTLSLSIPYATYHQDYANPIEAYRDYGFAYSLFRSALDRGVEEPDVYNEEIVENILSDVYADTPASPSSPARPNFIFLQLESFYDPANIKGVTCSENPVPTFSRLKDECSSGYLQVPSIGGGTANVEFEVLTGMRLNDFGTGEYPYTTVLKTQSCETVAHNLHKQGYTTHAIHNHIATFYDRHLVYPQLGFDTFTPLEYMQNYTANDLGWCHDDVLTGYILDALKQQHGRDMVFAISVQGHGNYLTEAPETPYPITADGLEDETLKNEFEYYINTLKETDRFLADLIAALEEYPEPVVLVAYGDHLPALSFDESDLVTSNHLATEYVIWTNDNSLPETDRDVAAFQLAAYVLEQFDISEGIIMRYHQQCADNVDYLEQLAVLEYDMLYGDRVLYEDDAPYASTGMRMGVKDITISSAVLHGDLLLVEGNHFTRHSVVYAGGNALSTQYINENMLIASLTLLSRAEPDDMITVAQVSADGTELSISDPVICQIAPE